MARTRAGAARAAFGRVDQVRVSGDSAGQDDSVNASFSASDNAVVADSKTESQIDSATADTSENTSDGDIAVVPTGQTASRRASSQASGRASRSAGKKAAKARRRVGRPRGPERVPLTIRVLAATDQRLTTAVEQTGDSPQYIVDAALAAYLDALGIPKG